MGCGASAPERIAPAEAGKRTSAVKGSPAPANARMGRRETIRRPGVSAEGRGWSGPAGMGSSSSTSFGGSSSTNGFGERRSSAIRSGTRNSITLGHTTIATYEKDRRTIDILKQATEDNPLFEPLSEEQRMVVYGAMVDDTVEKGEVVIREGERGDLFYVVESGAFAARLAAHGPDAPPVKSYASGGCFGELALLYNSPRAATVECTQSGTIWTIDRAVFNMIMIASNTEGKEAKQNFLKTIDLCQELDASKIDFLSTICEEAVFDVGDYVWNAGDNVEALYFLREGEIEICAPEKAPEDSVCSGNPDDGTSDNGRRTSSFLLNSFKSASAGSRTIKMRRGDWFGSAILHANLAMARTSSFDAQSNASRESARDFLSPRSATGGSTHVVSGKALGRVTLLVLRLSSLRSATANAVGDVPKLMCEAVKRKAERSIPSFLSLTPTQRVRLLTGLPARWVEMTKPLRSPPGMLGAPVNPVQVVVKGFAHEAMADGSLPDVKDFIRRGDGEAEGGGGEANGDNGDEEEQEEQADPNDDPNAERKKSTGWLAWGSCVDEQYLANPSLTPADEPVFAIGRDCLVVDLNADLLVMLASVMSKAARRSDNKEGGARPMPVISLDTLNHVAILGAGGYGAVWLVQDKGSNVTYALKKMSKAHVVAKRQVDHTNNERRLLALCDHPFVIELFSSFQDSTDIYLLLELILGGELFSYLDEHGPVDTEPARFYTASVACALEYLHDRNVVYRDLKPENLLIDSEGYIKIVDFGFAKVVYQGERTWTLCGTPEYLAPEVILRRGHDLRVDWWSLGILMIELFSGVTPFATDDQFEIFKRIVKCEINYDRFGLPWDALELAQGLLVVDPSQRLGDFEHGGGRALRESKFLEPIDFVQLANKSLPSPYVPYIESSTDTRHSPDEDELEMPETAKPVDGMDKKKLAQQFPEFAVLEGTDLEDWDAIIAKDMARRSGLEPTKEESFATDNKPAAQESFSTKES